MFQFMNLPLLQVIWKINESLPVTEHTSPGVVVLPSSRHLLRIPIVRAHHDGIYRCQAINRIGSADKTFILHVTGTVIFIFLNVFFGGRELVYFTFV